MPEHEYPDDHNADWPLLARYLAGDVDAAESVQVRAWLAADPARAELLGQAKGIWTTATGLRQERDVVGAMEKIHARIAAGADAVPLRRVSGSFRALGRSSGPWRSRLPWVIAGILAAASMVLAVWSHVPRSLATKNRVVPATARAFSTTNGQRATVELADGSHVQLGANSRITVTMPPGGRRDVTLEGEAIFDVVHDTARPFLVRARNAVTEDLGTTFGVRAYADDRAVRVAVLHGKVAVRPDRASSPVDITLLPGDVGRMERDGTVRVASRVDVAALFAWRQGELAFIDMPLGEVIHDLERWYGARITLTDAALGDRRLTATFRNEPFPSVARRIAAALGLTVKVSGNDITFQDAAASSRRAPSSHSFQ